MDWALLPQELLISIAEKLAYNDHKCFSCVFTSWHAVAKSSTSDAVQPIWLMLPAADSTGYLDFYDFAKNKIDKFYVPGVIGQFCFGLNLGSWIVARCENNYFSLHHLFTRVSVHIPKSSGNLCTLNSAITRALISSDPSTTIDWILILSLQQDQNFKYILFNNRHTEWTSIDNLWSRKIFKSTIYDKQLCAASCSYDIFVSDLDAPSYRLIHNSWMHDANYGYQGLYLVTSIGELLLVTRDRSDTEECEYFSVFRMDDMKGVEPKWTKIQSVGDRAIFVSENHCVSIDVNEYGGLFQKNCVYFCNPLGKFEGSNEGFLGMYSLENLNVELVSCCFDLTVDWKRASWIRYG